jgi:ATP-binding cassette, subfamily C (CFTR/MRP), member 1
MRCSWQILGERSLNLCRAALKLLYSNCADISYCRRGHGSSSSSGSSTPYPASGSLTPRNEEGFSAVDVPKEANYASTISEKSRHRGSFAKAKIAAPASSRKPSSLELSKEHSEQGRIKLDVYKQYIVAASKAGFSLFLLTTILQQAALVVANLTLRSWGEHNRQKGDNSGMLKYLIIYGSFSFSSTILGGASAILMWVFCALRSAQRLHDGVRTILLAGGFKC